MAAHEVEWEDLYSQTRHDVDLLVDVDAAEREAKNLWTVVDVDGEMLITAGYHYVNRMGYMTSREDWTSADEEYRW